LTATGLVFRDKHVAGTPGHDVKTWSKRYMLPPCVEFFQPKAFLDISTEITVGLVSTDTFASMKHNTHCTFALCYELYLNKKT